jgi:N-acetylmuramoyl-L-alanine amidase
MNFWKKWKTIAFLGALMFMQMMSTIPSQVYAAPLLKQGSQNGDVWDLQYRLKTLGYYKSPMDGIYGTGTTAAVRLFQKNYGLNVDGVTGDGTWGTLKRVSLNRSEVDILAKVIYSEARGEPYVGQVAVGAVVLNRIQSDLFPNTIREVVFQDGAFTAINDGQYWLQPNATAYLAALDALRGWDPTYNAMYYFNPETATSSWIRSRTQTVEIGNHIFAR